MLHSRRARLIALPVLAAGAVAVAPAVAADRGSQSPKQILSQVRTDLAAVQSVHVAGTQRDKDGLSHITGDLTSTGSFRLSIVQGKQKFRATLVDSVAYLNANAAFWRSAGGANGPTVSLLANRWVKMPPKESASLAKGFADLSPKVVARCVATRTGTVVKIGTATVGGRRTIILEDKGDKPGTAPGRLYVAAAGAALPVRETQTGPRRKGGKLDATCDDKTDTTTSESVRFSNYNKVAAITAPANPLDLTNLETANPPTTQS